MAERFGDYDNEWLDILGNMEQNIRNIRLGEHSSSTKENTEITGHHLGSAGWG